MTKFLRICLLLLSSCCTYYGYANNNDSGSSNTHGSTCTVKTNDSAAGLVYVNCATSTRSALGQYTHKQPAAPNDSDYDETITSTCESPGGGTTVEQVYYLYAKPNPGYKFVRWETTGSGAFESSDNPYTKTVSHSTKLPNHNPYNVTAIFIEFNAVNTECNIPAGMVVLDPVAPQIGDEVTATVKTSKLTQNNSIGNKNMMVEFSHWENGDGTFLSDEETYKFKVEEEMSLRAVYKNLGEVPQAGKYYRVRNVYNRVLSLEGQFKVSIPMTGADLSDAALRWALTYDHDYNEFWTSQANNDWDDYELDNRIWAEASPSTIFYIEDGKNSDTELNNGVLSSQGINTNTLTGEKIKVTPMDDAFYGYYGVVASSANGAAFQAMPRPADDNNPARCLVNVSQFKSASLYCALAVQPIDEEHIDYFWFGAKPDEALFMNDEYWTSMYTAFPYECYEPDGVEAYYVTETASANGMPYASLEKIESGIVPANTAVLLKCKSLDTKGNRLLPLNPSDSRIQPIERNMLRGVFQLYTNTNKEGRRLFDEHTMRVLGVNSAGEVGFYKLAKDYEGNSVELKANKIYLDLSSLAESAKFVSYSLGSDGDEASIEQIIEDGSSVKYENNDIFDLLGRKVTHPAAGNIYIINGKKLIWK